jgi:hypothetical protein
MSLTAGRQLRTDTRARTRLEAEVFGKRILFTNRDHWSLAHLMRRHAAHNGLHLSVRRLLAHLAGIQETVLLYQAERGRPRARRMITDTDRTQQRLFDLFDLDRYAPRR